MSNMIGLGERRSVDTQHQEASFWKRRLAAQVVSLLPDQRMEALEVLAEAVRIIEMPGPLTLV